MLLPFWWGGSPPQEVVLVRVLVKQLDLEMLPRVLVHQRLKPQKKITIKSECTCWGGEGRGSPPHLVDFVPLRVEALLDRLALEQLVTDLQHAVRVGLPLDEPPQELILPFQVKSLQEVDPQDPLQSRRVSSWVLMHPNE